MLDLAGKYIKIVTKAISHMFKKLRYGRLIKDLIKLLDMKTTSEMKNILEVIKTILGTEKEMINKLGDTAIKTIQSETHTHTHRKRGWG